MPNDPTNNLVLSKVKIGDKYYYLKDADARLAIDSILADYLKTADKTALQNAIDAVSGRVTTIEGDYVKAADLAAAVKVEADRAKVAEEALDGRLDVIEGDATTAGSIKKAVADEATARDAAIASAIEALDVTDAAVAGKYVSAVSETDGKITVTRADLPAADTYTLVKQATPDTGDASTYYLTKNGVQEGAKINIAKDQFLKDAKFCATATDVPSGHTAPTGTQFPAILFIFTRTAGDEDVWVPVKDLVDVYTEGNGIDITDNVITAVAKSGDKYIEVTADGIASKGIDTAISTAVEAEATIARAAEQANATAISNEVTRATGKEDELATAISAEETRAKAAEAVNANAIAAIKDGTTIDSFADVESALALKASDAALDALDARVTTAEGEIDALQAASHTHTNKTVLDGITSTKVTNWDNEVGAKAAAATEKTRAEGQEAAIRSEFAAADALKVDKTQKIAGIALSGDISAEAMQDALGLEDLAYSDTASGTGTIAAQTITGVKATGNISGTASISMGYTDTDATMSVKDYIPEGSIDVTLSGATFNKITSVGSMPTYVKESVTGGKATVIDTSKFNGGTQANFVQGSRASLTTSNISYVEEGVKVDLDDDDEECLVFTNITAKTAKAVDVFTANGDDTFTKNTVASLGAGFYKAGTDVTYTASQWTDGVAPTMESNTVAVATKSFTGTKVTDYVTGATYKKADQPTGNVTVTGASLDVGAITVPAQTISVTVRPDAE